MNPLFSIIIPTYNSETVIRACLQSICKQTFLDYEIIIIDSLSKDATIDIVKEYVAAHSNIHYLSEKDGGIYDAMNKGIRMSKGIWLYFIGADDLLYDNSILEKLVTATQSSKSKIIYGNVLVKGNAGWAADGEIYARRFSIKKIITQNICHQAIFYHREVFEKIGLYNERYRICADHDFNIRAAANFKFTYSDLIVAIFSGGGISTTPDYNFKNDFEKNIVKYCPLKLPFIRVRSYKLAQQADIYFTSKKFVRGVLLYGLYIWKRFIQQT